MKHFEKWFIIAFVGPTLATSCVDDIKFGDALQKQAQVEYLLDVLLFGETEEKADLITDYGKDVIQLEQRMAELAAADAARTKKHYERHAAAPER